MMSSAPAALPRTSDSSTSYTWPTSTSTATTSSKPYQSSFSHAIAQLVTRPPEYATTAVLLTRVPRRRRLPPGRARLRRRLTPLAALLWSWDPRPYYPYCPLRPGTASSARGTRGRTELSPGVSRALHQELERFPVSLGALA